MISLNSKNDNSLEVKMIKLPRVLPKPILSLRNVLIVSKVGVDIEHTMLVSHSR